MRSNSFILDEKRENMKKKYIAVALTGLVLVLMLFLCQNRNAEAILSKNDSDTLLGNYFYIQYSSDKLLANGKSVVIEEAVKNQFAAERYELDGAALLTVEDGTTSKVYCNDELVEQAVVDNSLLYPVVERYEKLTYQGRRGSIRIEDVQLNFEEYQYYSGGYKTVRFLYDYNHLWGLQFPKEGTHIKILELSREIPEGIEKYFV